MINFNQVTLSTALFTPFRHRYVSVFGIAAMLLSATASLDSSQNDGWSSQLFDVQAHSASAIELNANVVALANGTNITSPQGRSGHGTLRVINGTNTDAAIKLVDRDSGRTLRFVYVQAGHEVTIEAIEPCTCILKFTTGANWDENRRRFSSNASFAQFDDLLDFRETSTDSSVIYEATLNPVVDGNAPTTSINEGSF